MLATGMVVLLASMAMAQQSVTGTVVDQAGEPLPGVSIIVKGSSSGTVTDLDGKYKITVPQPESTLIFSFIGMEAQEIVVGSQSVIDIAMMESNIELNEVVVVAYGTQKKVNLSGAVDQLDGKVIEQRPVSSIAQGLQGAVPNLNIDFAGGAPGATPNINIRGIASINGGNPLILIDGIPSEVQDLNRISPQDVESYSVIKDASASAVYGARAAFGVIIITTKTGRDEGMKVNYTNNFSWDKPTVLPQKITDPYIYLRWQELSTNNTPWDNMNFSDETYQWARERSDDPSIPGVRPNPNDPTSWEYMGNRDWTQYFLSEYTVSQNHQVDLSGASAKTNYFVSGNYNRQNGALAIADDYFDRYGFRAKVNYNPTDWLRFGNNTFLNTTQRNRPSGLDFWTLYNLQPVDMDKNPDGTWANTEVGREAASLVDGGDYVDDYTNVQSRFEVELKFLKDDALRFNADYTIRREINDQDYNTKQYNIGFGPEDVREVGNNYAYKSTTYEYYNVFNIYGTYDKAFGKHHLTAIAGFNQEDYRYEWYSAERNNVISASLPTIALATGDAFVNEQVSEWAIRGAFYRLNYTFNDRYILEFNGRYDGSSRFPSDQRFGFFPSASAAWRISEEAFMDPLENVVSNLKLRGSYGVLGNQNVGAYGYIPSMQASQANVIIGGERPLRVTPPPLVSGNYTWEEVSTLNIGVDLGLFQNKIMASLDVFQRDTKGMLTQGRDLPDVLGAAEPRENAGDLRTTGWELSIDYQDEVLVADKPFSFGARFILSDTRSEITRFDNPNQNLTQYYEGMELGEIWGLTSDGLFQSDDEIAAHADQTQIIPWGALSIVPGWPRYIDQDGNGAIEKGLTVDDPKDLSIIGNRMPRMRYGLNLNFMWNGFDFSAFLQGVGQRDYYPQDHLYWGFYQQPYEGGYPHLLDFYRPQDDPAALRAQHSQAYLDAGLADANPDAFYPIMQAWLADRNLGERIDQAQGLAIPQTRYMLNGAYLRLKNLTLGYSIPQVLTDKLKIERLRVFVSGENIAEWSELSDLYDPEAINDNINFNPASGNGRGTGSGYIYPFQRRYAVGLNLTF